MSELSRVRGIVFDLDGTLVDGFAAITTAVNAARANAALPPLSVYEVTSRVGRGLDDLLASVLPAAEVARGIEIFRSTYASVCEEGSRPMPGARAVLAGLAVRGFRLSVASNKLALFSRRILAALDLDGGLDVIHGPETAGAPKPNPAMIRACLSAMGVTADEAIYAGDMPLDVDAARHAGVGVVLLAGGASPRALLQATGVPVFDGLSGLATALPQRPAVPPCPEPPEEGISDCSLPGKGGSM